MSAFGGPGLRAGERLLDAPQAGELLACIGSLASQPLPLLRADPDAVAPGLGTGDPTLVVRIKAVSWCAAVRGACGPRR